MFSDKMILRNFFFFFSMFGCIPENVLENILQYYATDRAEGARVRHAFFKNSLRKN